MNETKLTYLELEYFLRGLGNMWKSDNPLWVINGEQVPASIGVIILAIDKTSKLCFFSDLTVHVRQST